MLDVSLISALSAEGGGGEEESTRTAVVPVVEPFAVSTSTQPAKHGALLAATLSVPGPRGVVVEGITLAAEGAEVAGSSLGSVSWPQSESCQHEGGAVGRGPGGPVPEGLGKWRTENAKAIRRPVP